MEAVLSPGGVESPLLGPFEDAGGSTVVGAEVAEEVTEGDEDPVAVPVEAVLLSLSVHSVVVAVAVVVVSEPDEVELEDDETVTLCVRVVSVVAEDEVAVYVGVQSLAGKVNVPLWLPDPP